MPLFFTIVCAVIVANAACAATAVGIIAATRLEKRGFKQDDLPLWVYFCVLPGPVLGAFAAWMMAP